MVRSCVPVLLAACLFVGCRGGSSGATTPPTGASASETPSSGAPSPSASASNGPPSPAFEFECDGGKVTLGLGFGGFYRHSLSSLDGTTPARPVAEALCGRASGIDACMADANARSDAGLGTLEWRLVIANGRLASLRETTGGSPTAVTTCVEHAITGAATSAADGALHYAYVADVSRGRLGSAHRVDPSTASCDVTASGGLPVEIVQRIVRQRLPKLLGCYRALLETAPSSKGSLSLSFSIDARGATQSLRVTKGTLTDQTAQSCVVAALGDMTFPAADGAKSTTAVAQCQFAPGADGP